MRRILFLTGNANKLREARQILSGFDIVSDDTDLPELQEINEQLIVEDKIRHALKLIDKEVFIDDVSLCFDAFNGLPGPLVKWFLKTVGIRGLVDMLSGFENKEAYAKCYIGYGKPARDGKAEEIHVFEGIVKGVIVEPAGETKFGWDPIFMPEGCDKTYAQMTADEKNSISHRSIAFKKFKEHLEKQ